MTDLFSPGTSARPKDGRDPLDHAAPAPDPATDPMPAPPGPAQGWDETPAIAGVEATLIPGRLADTPVVPPFPGAAGLAAGDPAPLPLRGVGGEAPVLPAAHPDLPAAVLPGTGGDGAAVPARLPDSRVQALLSGTSLTPVANANTGADPAAAGPAAAGGTAVVVPSGNPYIDGMLDGTKWSGNSITYSFPGNAAAYSSIPAGGGEALPPYVVSGLPVQHANDMRAIFEGIPNAGVMRYGSFESITNLNFTELTGADSVLGGATIRVAISTALDPVAPAYAYLPGTAPGSGDIWFSNAYFGAGAPDASPIAGSYGYVTGIHEAGHALGLKHPHDTLGGALPTDMDSHEFTVMSYRSTIGADVGFGYTNETWGYPTTPMMLDIQALQHLYGADYTTNATDTTYKWNPATGEMSLNGAGMGAPGGNRIFMTVWDGGGRDTYDFSNYTNGVSADLRPGKWSVNSETQRAVLDIGFSGSVIKSRGTVFNALLFNDDSRSLIEDAIGGSGNDTLIGNQAANLLTGNDGNDRIVGDLASETTPGGHDTLLGGIGNDWLDGGKDNDVLSGGAGLDTILGGSGADSIVTGTGNDSVDAGDGNDRTNWLAGDGNDTVRGGTGTDTLDLQGWTGPGTGTDNIAAGTYGAWTVQGGTGPNASRTFLTTIGGGATIVASSWEAIMCFAAGTRIATARGEVAVERLRLGDLVVTLGGGGAPLRPVTWLGRSRVAPARHPDREAVAPVLIRAGALGDGVPHRDLRVSPEHALFLDERLVPAALLVNGTSIVQELWCPAVEYWHVELPAHAVMVAEGAAAESYFDDGNRRHFDNGPVAALFPDFASERPTGAYDRAACHPVLRHGPALEAIRAQLAARVAAPAGAPRRRAV